MAFDRDSVESDAFDPRGSGFNRFVAVDEHGDLPPGKDPKLAPSHHTPDFYVDESGMKTGVKAFLYLVTDYMKSAQGNKYGKVVKQKSF